MKTCLDCDQPRYLTKPRCKPHHNAWRRENRRHDADKQREYNLRGKYGLSLEDFDRMLRDQEYRCKICRTHITSVSTTHLYVDHDHKTDTVRGLLCNQCNVGLGQFKDDPELLQAAISYLAGV